MTLTSYIQQALRAEIDAGRLSSSAMTLGELSKRYVVSLTPVRAAVEGLIRDGYLCKDENRRLTVVPRNSRKASAVRPPEQPKDYNQIISDDLVRLSLKGEEVAIREETTAEKYGISRSSVREIFCRLAGNGILKHLPRRGWQLRPLRQADLDAYIEVRVSLELKALKLAWPRLADEDLRRMLNQNRLPSSSRREPESDDSLHAYLIEKAGNPYIADFFERHGRYYKVLFEWEGLDRKARIQAVRHHRAILFALLRRDRPAAIRALKNHIRHNHPVLQRVAGKSHVRKLTAASKKEPGR